MIRWPDRTLPQRTQKTLETYQRAVDAVPDYEQRVQHATKTFSAHNIKGNKVFDAVKYALTRMCSGARRCGYCEDSAADEIEHIKPKSLYPELTFVWLNYLYACGPCNTSKSSKFAVFDFQTGNLVDVQRKPKAPIVPPAPGTPALIDPRVEDPSDFLFLDLGSTFCFSPRTDIDPVEHQRAKYTIDVLGLNERAYLRIGRKQAYFDFIAHLKQYRTERDRGASQTQLRAMQRHILGRPHPTVWMEMKRQHAAIRLLKKLFGAVPEALHW